MTMQNPDPDEACTVHLRGRVSGEPEHRVLPSGDELWTVRVVVRRPPGDVRAGGPVSDWIGCTARSGAARRSVQSWRDGDAVEVEGALRRHYYRSGTGAALSLVEVEVARARRRRRAVPPP
ncbi:single-stranded DNA-binding protein [Nocardioides massiliensis]|uniref:Single-strand DNA-binding protein n=1 Tax=Nocardioides massiliensis TaxID=1325935 RepID=A0ABT9NU37_9ACTN|nr:single-stranded DNA-binding protein [Nocardioides massiliensis]MDP9823945.1 single-strand DNA-binding protein [Nocardioides massiliensis]